MGDAGKQCGVELVSIVMNFATNDDVAPIRKENLQRFAEQMDRYSDNALAAGIPGRHELFNGETNYPFIIGKIEKAGYKGYFGLEYFPLLPCPETLIKTMEYLSGKQ